MQHSAHLTERGGGAGGGLKATNTGAEEKLEQPNSRESFFVNNKEKAPDSLSIEILGAVRRQFQAQG